MIAPDLLFLILIPIFVTIVHTSCGGNLTLVVNDVKRIGTPGYGGAGFPVGVECTWSIIAPPNSFIIATIERFDVVQGCYDAVRIKGMCKNLTVFNHITIFVQTTLNCQFYVKACSNQLKIATDWLQTGFGLAIDSKIGVNGIMLYQCNPTAFY